MKRLESAFIFPSLILLLSVFTILIITGYTLAGSHIGLIRDSIHSDRAELTAEQAVIRIIGMGASPPLPAGMHCPSEIAAVGEQSITRTLCMRIGGAPQMAIFLSESSFSNPDEFPLINIGSYLSSQSPCTLTPFPPSNISASGFDLTPSAHRASFSCKAAPTVIIDNFASLANLELDYRISTQALALPNAAIASAGFIDLPLGVSLNSDLVLVAGGDIHIGALLATVPTQLTVISLSGFIKIDNMSGPVSLRAWGRAGVSAPANLTPLNNLYPITLKSLLLGRVRL